MKVKVSEATPIQINWMVAKCEEARDKSAIKWDSDGEPLGPIYDANCGGYPVYEPSTDWSQGGQVIEREEIAVWWDGVWHAKKDGCQPHQVQDADTPLIAAMRCFVASRLGDEVDVPEELA